MPDPFSSYGRVGRIIASNWTARSNSMGWPLSRVDAVDQGRRTVYMENAISKTLGTLL
jgi:hypothetical protein